MACTHPQRLGSLCAVCGATLPPETKEDAGGGAQTRRVATSATRAALAVTTGEAATVAAARRARLEKRRQLQLVLDLDHTLLECSTDARAAAVPGVAALGDVAGRPHWARLRPGLKEFFDRVSPLYELAIYTHGSRDYALAVRRALEVAAPGVKFAGVVSRDCCPDLRGEKSLERLFPGGAARALILDDRLDVWTRGEDQTARVLCVQPYKYLTQRLRLGPAHEDGDGQLAHSATALEAVHAAFYADETAGDVVARFRDVHSKVFAGCSLAFNNEPDVYAARLAERYGARVVEDEAEATHLLTLEAPIVPTAADTVVHLDWFWYSVWRCRREGDARYRLKAPEVPLAEAYKAAMSRKRPRDDGGAAAAAPPDAGSSSSDGSSDEDDLDDLEAEMFG